MKKDDDKVSLVMDYRFFEGSLILFGICLISAMSVLSHCYLFTIFVISGLGMIHYRYNKRWN